MQSVEIRGLDKVTKALETMPDAIRQARAEALEDAGRELLGAVRRRIGGAGRVQGVQDYHMGSGKGYAAVRAKAKTELDGYAAGYVTNALEGGHRVRAGSGARSRAKMDRAPGKYMYRDTGAQELPRVKEDVARRIEDAAVRALKGGGT